jgi:hypothetical protein
MTTHALFAPSAMARILACPPSAVLSAGLPERVSGPAAGEGTRVHKVLEQSLRTSTLPEAMPWDALKGSMPDRDVVLRTRAFIDQLEPGQLLVEHKVTLLAGTCWGTLDIGKLGEEIITVFDYKNGGFDIQAKDNKQGLTYAATFLDSHPHVNWFRIVIFQPNSWGAQGDDFGFKQHVHSRAEVIAHRQQVTDAVNYAGPVKPGPHCRWCDAIPACPAMSQDAYFLMACISRDTSTLSPHELVRMLRITRALGDRKDELEGRLTDALKAGAQVEGAKLKQSTKWEQWNDERHAVAHLYQIYGERGVKPLTVSAAKKLGTAGEQYARMASHRPPPEDKASY